MVRPLELMAEELAGCDESQALGLLEAWQQEGIAAARLQAAILQARNLGLDSAAGATAEILGHYDRLQARWIHFLEDNWTGKIHTLEDRLAEKDQASLVQEAHTHWLKAGHVDLHNYHCEMPLVAQVNLVSMREHGFSVSCTPDLALLISASEQQRTAYLQLPGAALRLKLVVEGTSGRSVHFREERLLSLEREQRRHIRVMCKEPISMKIRHEKGPKWDAIIHNYSAFGLGISSTDKLPWPEGQALLCLFEMREKSMEVHGTVRWKIAANGLTRMGLELPREHAFVHLMQMQVAERQHEIIRELKVQGAPDTLLEVPVEARRL